jgi:hypothetical protein
MARLSSLAPFAAVFLFLAPMTARAASFFGPIVPPACNCADVNGVSTAPAYGCVLATIQNLINFGVTIGIVVFTFALVYAGFVWMTSGGNPEARNKGRSMLLNVIIGLVILLIAWLVVDFIMKKIYNSDAYGPWNGILAPDAGDQCIVATNPSKIEGILGGALTGELGGTGNQIAPTGGTGNNCPAASPSGMVAFPAAATAGGAQKATPATVQNFMAMRAAALKDGIDLKVTDGYRSDAEQVVLWERYHHDTSQVAQPCSLNGPGSNHNSGIAVDIDVGCTKTNSSCSSPAFRWLKTHGSAWNFRNALPKDVIHWSPSGH